MASLQIACKALPTSEILQPSSGCQELRSSPCALIPSAGTACAVLQTYSMVWSPVRHTCSSSEHTEQLEYCFYFRTEQFLQLDFCSYSAPMPLSHTIIMHENQDRGTDSGGHT